MEYCEYLEDLTSLGLRPIGPVDLEAAMRKSNEMIELSKREFLEFSWFEGDGDGSGGFTVVRIHPDRVLVSVDGQLSIFPYGKEIEIHGIKCIAERLMVRNDDNILCPMAAFDEVEQ